MSHAKSGSAGSDEMASAASSLDVSSVENWPADAGVSHDTTHPVSEMPLPGPSAFQIIDNAHLSTPASAQRPPAGPIAGVMTPLLNLPPSVGFPSTDDLPPASTDTPPKPLPTPPVRRRLTYADSPAIPKPPVAPPDSPLDAVIAAPNPATVAAGGPANQARRLELVYDMACLPFPQPTWTAIVRAVEGGGGGRDANGLAADAQALMQAEMKSILDAFFARGRNCHARREAGGNPGPTAFELIFAALQDPQLHPGPTKTLLEAELASIKATHFAKDHRCGTCREPAGRRTTRDELLSAALREPSPGESHARLISSYELPPAPARTPPAGLPGFLHQHHPRADCLAALRAAAGGELRAKSEHVESARRCILDRLGSTLSNEWRKKVVRRRTSEVSTTRLKALASSIKHVWSVALFGAGVPVNSHRPTPAPPVDRWARLAQMLREEGENAKDYCKQLMDALLNEHAARFVPSTAVDMELVESLVQNAECPTKDPVAIFEEALETDGPGGLAKLVEMTLPRPTLSLPVRFRGCIAVALREKEGLPALRALFKLLLNEADFAVEARGAVVLGVRQCLIDYFGGSDADDLHRMRQCRTSEASRVREKSRAPLRLSFLEDALTLPS